MPVCLIYNPAAQGEKAKKIRGFLESLRGKCVLRGTTGPGAARTLARAAVEEGFDTIVAAGGDGTINEVVNGLAEAPEGCARARLGLLPSGTVNVFARELGIPLDIPRAWEVAQQGREIRIDLPCAEYSVKGAPQRRYFVQMGGAGLDALAVETASWELKKKIGRFAYVVSALKALRAGLPQITVTADGRAFSGELILLGNGRYYGGSFPLFRRASLRDGLLDVCVFPKVTWAVLLRYAWSYVAQRDTASSTEHHFTAARVELTCSSRAPFELDGENVGCLPVICSVQREALRVLAPPPK